MASRKHTRKLPTAAEVRAAFKYDPETGILTWRWRYDVGLQWNRKHAGKRAGTASRTGKHGKSYRLLRLNGCSLSEHVVIWIWMTGEWPDDEVDHEDGDGLRNVWENLRPATRAQNSANAVTRRDSRSGIKGVRYVEKLGKYMARVQGNGERHYLGVFPTKKAAKAARDAKARELHGAFFRP